ncbi:hypothetical protein Tco_0445059 [Tanacetum coccineum]
MNKRPSVLLNLQTPKKEEPLSETTYIFQRLLTYQLLKQQFMKTEWSQDEGREKARTQTQVIPPEKKNLSPPQGHTDKLNRISVTIRVQDISAPKSYDVTG